MIHAPTPEELARVRRVYTTLPAPPTTEKAIAYHESGHCLVSWLIRDGAESPGICYTSDGGGICAAEVAPGRDKPERPAGPFDNQRHNDVWQHPDIQRMAWRSCLLFEAGLAAELVLAGDWPAFSVAPNRGSDDDQVRFWSAPWGCTSGFRYILQQRLMGVLHQHWPKVEVLSHLMQEDGAVQPEDCQRVLSGRYAA